MTNQPKEQASNREAEASRKEKAPADPSNNLSRGAPHDRDERIDQMRKDKAQQSSRKPERRPEDLDREDAAIQREGIADEKAGIRPQGDADFVREKG